MAIADYLKSVSYLVKSKPYRLEKPIVLQFPVIDICNSHCQMCRIWENKKSDDITPDQLRTGLRNPLYSEVTSVGLNGGEPTLRKDLAELASVLFEELPKLNSISLITNAFNFQDVIERISELGQVVRKHKGYLDVMVSLDGYGDVHDRVRGKPGNFERAQKVINFAMSSDLVHNVRIGCTIIKENVYGLAELFEFCQSRGLYIKYRLGIPHQRLYTQNLTDPYSLTTEEKYHIAEFLEGLIAHYESNEQQKFFYRSLIDQILHGAPRKAGCDWQHRGATISSSGELLYCAVQSKALGKIAECDSEQAYFKNAGHLQDIIKNKCDNCNHDYVGIPPKKQLAKQLSIQMLHRLGIEQQARSIYRRLNTTKRKQLAYVRKLESLKAISGNHGHTKKAREAAVKVLVCGWYGTETLGDKAILAGVMESIRKTVGQVDFTLVSLYPYISQMTRRQMPELKGTHIVDPHEGIRLVGDMDLVVFGGGPLMAINELAEMEAIFYAAHQRGIPSLVAGCGVGPIGDDWHNKSLYNILTMASLRIYRDVKSRELATKLGVDTTGDIVAEDPAFTWLKNQRERLTSTPPSDRKVLLLGLRDFPYQQYARHLSPTECIAAKERYEHEVIAALERLAERHADLVIRPLPMCTNHFGDDDRWFYRRLFRGNKKLEERLDLSLLGAELAPSEYGEAFCSAHVALTMRFHSVVFALGLEVPTVAIDYTLGKGKVHALAERFGVPYQSLADIDTDFIVGEVDLLLQKPIAQAAGFVPSFSKQLMAALPLHMNRQGEAL